MADLIPKPRAAARVRDYLLKEFAKGDAGKRLPTIRSLSDHLKVSFTTVQSVYKSLSDEGHITTQVGRGSFFNPQADLARTLQVAITISHVLEDHDSPHFWMDSVYRGLLRATHGASRRIHLFALPPGAEGGKFLAQKSGGCDGLLMLEWEDRDERESLEGIARQQRIPVVYLRPPSVDDTVNFVASNFFEFGSRAGSAFAAAGRKRVLYLANANIGVWSATSLTYAGLATGLGQGAIHGPELRFLNAGEGLLQGPVIREEFEKFIAETGYVPDAIFCAGDFLAIEALKVMAGRKCKIPGEVSVIGASGVNLSGTEWPALTRVRHPFHKIGQVLIESLIQRVEKQGADISGVYLDCSFIGGSTTTAKENRVLEVSSDSVK